MTLQAVAGFLGQTGLQHPAMLYRNQIAAIAGRRSGFFRYGDFTLTPSGANMSITIGRGEAYVHGTEAVTTQGGYFVWNNTNEVLAWPAAAAQPRIDSLILRVIDTDYGSDPAGSKATWEIVQGTPAGSPVQVPDSAFAPAGAYYHPGAWMRVANYTLGASITNLAAATAAPGVNYVRQGRLQVVSAYGSEPADPQRGDVVQYLSGNHAGVGFNYTGSGWTALGWSDWQTWSPVVRNNGISGTPTTISSTTDHARYKRVGDIVLYNFALTVNAAAANGASVSLPVSSPTIRTHHAGNMYVFGSGAPSDQVGVAYQGGGPGAPWDRLYAVSINTGLRDFASGNVVRGSGFYYVDK